MRYINAQDVFPKDVLALIQDYVDGEYIYIPRKNRRCWGQGTNAKIETKKRNEVIYKQYKSGHKVAELALEYFLSEKSIQRIVTQGKKQEL